MDVSDGETGLGATGREVHERLGRRIETTWEITEYEPNHKVVYRSTSGPGEYESAWTYESVDGGTKLAISTQWEVFDGRTFGKLSARVLEQMYHKSLGGDLQSLKRLLEA